MSVPGTPVNNVLNPRELESPNIPPSPLSFSHRPSPPSFFAYIAAEHRTEFSRFSREAFSSDFPLLYDPPLPPLLTNTRQAVSPRVQIRDDVHARKLVGVGVEDDYWKKNG